MRSPRSSDPVPCRGGTSTRGVDSGSRRSSRPRRVRSWLRRSSERRRRSRSCRTRPTAASPRLAGPMRSWPCVPLVSRKTRTKTARVQAVLEDRTGNVLGLDRMSREPSAYLDNLLLICSFHHRLVHEHGWSVRRDDDGTVAGSLAMALATAPARRPASTPMKSDSSPRSGESALVRSRGFRRRAFSFADRVS